MKDKPLYVYAVNSCDSKIRKNSSSGGVFSHLANNVLNMGGIVYGVALNPVTLDAEMIRISSIQDLYKINGSKYMQARINNAYKLAKEDLEENKIVLFSGTGCQINGLKLFLGEKYDNLISVDVLCHGVPSPLIWKKHIESIEKKKLKKIIDVNFRDKIRGWSNYSIKYKFDRGNILHDKEDDSFMKLFLSNIILRPSCYNCKAKEDKKSDITLGDFWGVGKFAPMLYDDLGTSVVFIRTENGNRVFDSIKDDLVIKEIAYDEAIENNPVEYRSVKMPQERDVFFEDNQVLKYEELVKKYTDPSKKRVACVCKKTIQIWLFKIGARRIIASRLKRKI